MNNNDLNASIQELLSILTPKTILYIIIFVLVVYLMIKAKIKAERIKEEKELERMKPILDYQAKQIAIEMDKLNQEKHTEEQPYKGTE